MAKMLRVLLSFIVHVVVFSGSRTLATVSLSRDPVDGIACRGAPVSFTCVTDNDALSWLDSNDATLGNAYLGTTSSIGDEQVVMNFNLNLTNISMSVLTSTASTNASESAVVLQCADGAGNDAIGIVNGRPNALPVTWERTCISFDEEVRLSWTGPTDRNCCTSYQLELTGGPYQIPPRRTTNTSLIIESSALAPNASYKAYVTCRSAEDFGGIPSEPRTVGLSVRNCSMRLSSCSNLSVTYDVSLNLPETAVLETCPDDSVTVNCFYGSGNTLEGESLLDRELAKCTYSRSQVDMGNISVSVIGNRGQELTCSAVDKCEDTSPSPSVSTSAGDAVLQVRVVLGVLLVLVSMMMVLVSIIYSILYFKLKKKIKQLTTALPEDNVVPLKEKI